MSTFIVTVRIILGITNLVLKSANIIFLKILYRVCKIKTRLQEHGEINFSKAKRVKRRFDKTERELRVKFRGCVTYRPILLHELEEIFNSARRRKKAIHCTSLAVRDYLLCGNCDNS